MEDNLGDVGLVSATLPRLSSSRQLPKLNLISRSGLARFVVQSGVIRVFRIENRIVRIVLPQVPILVVEVHFDVERVTNLAVASFNPRE